MVFEKGHKPYKGIEKSQFKVGYIPWNKGEGELKETICKHCGKIITGYACINRVFCNINCKKIRYFLYLQR